MPTAIRTEQLIARHGFAIIAVGFDLCEVPGCDCARSAESFVYTVGLHRRGLPELLVTGLSPVVAAPLIHDVERHHRNGSGVPPETPQLVGDLTVAIRPVSTQWLANDPSRMAAWFAHAHLDATAPELPAVVQLVWSDAAGHLPPDPRCDPFVAEAQPIVADDPFTFPRRIPRADRRRAMGRRPVSSQRRSA